MAFTRADAEYVDYNVWSPYNGSLETPCNVYFATGVDGNFITTRGKFEAFMAAVKQQGRWDGSPVCAFSLAQTECGWETVLSYIKRNPLKFQTITTPSRHGKYKVMWVFFRTNGRKF